MKTLEEAIELAYVREDFSYHLEEKDKAEFIRRANGGGLRINEARRLLWAYQNYPLNHVSYDSSERPCLQVA